MKKITIVIVLALSIIGCGVKQTRTMLTTGDYDGAIQNALSGLSGNKNAKGKQDYVYMLEEAFAKAKERDLANINLWNKERNPNNFEKIYNTYLQLNSRQESIKPLLPLLLIEENRNAIFPFDNYSEQMISSKNDFSKYLYDNSKALLNTKDKINCRRAYDDFMYLEKINSNYKETKSLIENARLLGTDFVNVSTKNETNQVIPNRLLADLLDFSTYGLDDKWTVYHSNKQRNITYDYGIIVNFRQIDISPEQVKEREFIKEKQVKDGTKPLLDANNNPVKDQAGNPIRVDNFKNIRVNIYEYKQFKTVQLTAKVDYINFKNNQLVDSFPVSSAFNFENIYATFNGDKTACETDYFQYFDKRSVPFPSNEQMIFDCGEDLKNKLKDIITKNIFRK